MCITIKSSFHESFWHEFLQKKAAAGCRRSPALVARVARWYFFQTKNPNLGKNFESLAMEDVGIFYGHFGLSDGRLVHIFWSFGIFFSVLVSCTEKHLATLDASNPRRP
jgi:hypothetical protein